MPPGANATPVQLKTFQLPEKVTGSIADVAMGKEMVETWRRDGIFQIEMTPGQGEILKKAYMISKDFFALPAKEKVKHVDDQSFSGYIARLVKLLILLVTIESALDTINHRYSGEEITDGVADYSEIFTVTKDVSKQDPRVRQQWPCHGPCPWPNDKYKDLMTSVMKHFEGSGDKLLHLTALGLALCHETSLQELTDDGWHHMRILRFPAMNKTNGKGKAGRGIGSHTDYGLLVIASQDHIGGLFIRPPIAGEEIRNWEQSAAGKNEDDDKWTYIPPKENVLTVFPGDMMQYITSG
ncbi:MAG: hypothetical protein Q9160_004635 [Pyrenula sp. 1 TL-2023]